MSITRSPASRFSGLSADLRVLDETLASESEDAIAFAPKGPDLFSLAPRSQLPTLCLLTIGLEDRGGSSPGTEVGHTVTLFVAALDLGLGCALVKSSLEEGRTSEHKPQGISISSLLGMEGVGYFSPPNERAGAVGGMPILTTQAAFAAVIAASRSDLVALVVLVRLGVKPFRRTVPSRSMVRLTRGGEWYLPARVQAEDALQDLGQNHLVASSFDQQIQVSYSPLDADDKH